MRILLDVNSKLKRDQIERLNTILVSQYQRFRRATKQNQKEEELPSKSAIIHSGLLVNLLDRKYNNVVTLDFDFNCSSLLPGNTYLLARLGYNFSSYIWQDGISTIDETTDTPEFLSDVGYFKFTDYDGGSYLAFTCTSSFDGSLSCHIWWNV